MCLRDPPSRKRLSSNSLGISKPQARPYHHWLSPSEVGERFGLSGNDIEKISAWIESEGLHVSWVAPSRIFIGFSGTAANINRAFQTELHYYNVNGERRASISSDPIIPQMLVPVIRAIRGLYTIDDKPLHHAKPGRSDSPEFNSSGGNHYIAPADFATIYDLPHNLTGSGVTIGIVGRSRTDFADFDNFRSKTGSTFADPTEIIPTAFGGVDPGPAYTAPPNCTPPDSAACEAVAAQLDDQLEATLDVLRAGSVAPGATLLLVVDTTISGNLGADMQYFVNTEPVPAQIVNISFGACEAARGTVGVDYWDTLFQQAAAEGISVFVASGDSGASGCDAYFKTPPANPSPNSPNYICSSSYATCAGGTEFSDGSDPARYWSSTTGPDYSSALSYIPEGGWNEPLNSNSTPQAASSGGGVSQVIATPAWQTGAGVPAARVGRYTPDISFSASGHDGYFGCLAARGYGCVSAANGSFGFEYFAGTSAAAPDMAGVTALLDQKLGAAQGNLNPELYQLAAGAPAAFHDVTVSTSGVTTCNINTPSMCNNSIPGPTGLTGGQAGFPVTAGYDEVTGLGSLDVGVFLADYVTPLSIVSFTASPATVLNSGNVTLSFQLSKAAPSGGAQLTLTSSNSFAFPVPGIFTIPAGKTTTSFVQTAGTVAVNTPVTVTALYNGRPRQASVTVSPPSPAASAVTGAATAITATTAKLAGSSNPNGSDTHVDFVYGTSSALLGANTTPSQDIGSGTSAVNVSASLSGLTRVPSTTMFSRPPTAPRQIMAMP